MLRDILAILVILDMSDQLHSDPNDLCNLLVHEGIK